MGEIGRNCMQTMNGIIIPPVPLVNEYDLVEWFIFQPPDDSPYTPIFARKTLVASCTVRKCVIFEAYIPQNNKWNYIEQNVIVDGIQHHVGGWVKRTGEDIDG
jgi:hypothetical protein